MFTAARVELPLVAMERSMQETLQVMLVIMAPSILAVPGWPGEQASYFSFEIC
jgi:hypothetical protein